MPDYGMTTDLVAAATDRNPHSSLRGGFKFFMTISDERNYHSNRPKRVNSFRRFLHETQGYDEVDRYVQIPKKLLVDPRLTNKQKLTWIVLACFQYGPTRDIFPGRDRLARLLRLKSKSSISKLTNALQVKAYLEKFYRKNSSVIYEIYYDSDVDDSIFTRSNIDLAPDLVPSPLNKIKHDNEKILPGVNPDTP